MKKVTVLAVALLGLAASAFSRDDFVLRKVQPSVVRTPQINYTGDQRRSGQAQQWLEIEAEFDSNVDITDELTAKFYVLVAGQCLTGEVTHVNVLKGRSLYSVMYVSPHTVSKLLNNKPMTAASIENAGVQLLVKGQLVAQKSFKESGGGDWWQQLQQISGLLFNKNETPFAALYWDRYEEIKPAATK